MIFINKVVLIFEQNIKYPTDRNNPTDDKTIFISVGLFLSVGEEFFKIYV